ncbi:hypothetical protein GCM10023094_03770 [Rhodococcus olei]|uniref:Uncharacterized protein n=1 Tax=Rhodococcus olei TaxID=2161675 RepID=A0ABP8NS49_9NOCA
MQGVAGVGLDPVTGWFLQLGRCDDLTPNPGGGQCPAQPEPGIHRPHREYGLHEVDQSPARADGGKEVKSREVVSNVIA